MNPINLLLSVSMSASVDYLGFTLKKGSHMLIYSVLSKGLQTVSRRQNLVCKKILSMVKNEILQKIS